MSAPVALVLVSHSRLLADGVAQLAGQMAPDVTIIAVGGDGHGGLGTDFDAIATAIGDATADGRSAVVLTDLGSAVLSTEAALELLDDDVAARVRLADAPLVEGAVAAGVRAAGGADADSVLGAATGAGRSFAERAPEPTPVPQPQQEGAVTATVLLRNPMGLHARPAAIVARLVAGYDAEVTIDGADAASVLELMRLGAPQGHEITVHASGQQAQEAVDAVVAAAESGFGEL